MSYMSEIYGIIGAMDVEVKSLKEAMNIEETVERAGMTFCEGTLGNEHAVVVQSGVGKVNAALYTQILIDEFHVTHVINTGIAGSLDNRLNIGDVVVSTDACYHDVNATVFGYKEGQVPGMSELAFPADAALIAQVKAAAGKVASNLQVLEGRVCSGDQFIADSARKNEIKEKFGGLCCEMEGSAIAQTCFLNHIPFVIVRKISDKADGSDVMEYVAFEKQAARDSAAIVEAMMNK